MLTAGGLGYAPKMPGLAGSAGGLLLFFGAHVLGREWLAAPLAAFFFLATWLLGPVAIRAFGTKDPQRVVADEVCGYLIAVAFTLETTGGAFWTRALVGFGLFRIFDMTKPWPIRKLERLPGGLGIVTDDVAAGLIANVALCAGYAAVGAIAAQRV